MSSNQNKQVISCVQLLDVQQPQVQVQQSDQQQPEVQQSEQQQSEVQQPEVQQSEVPPPVPPPVPPSVPPLVPPQVLLPPSVLPPPQICKCEQQSNTPTKLQQIDQSSQTYVSHSSVLENYIVDLIKLNKDNNIKINVINISF